MIYISDNDRINLKNTAVTLGKFDGLHLGHRLLIELTKQKKELGYTTVLFSFLLHPYNLLSNIEFEQIYTEEEKREKLSQLGLDVFVSYPFTEETRNMEAEDFVREILIEKLDAKVVIVGSDYRFGRNRSGDVTLLQKLSKDYGYELIVCDKLTSEDGSVISSSKIREELAKSNMELVSELLGEPYSIIGEVMHGRKIGRTLGMPTTNLIPPSNKLLPMNGVYATTTKIDGQVYQGVTNIGFKPTVGADPMKGVETFIFDFDGDLYGKTIEVSLHTYMRPELTFPSVDILKETMEQDIIDAKNYFLSKN